MKTPPLPHARPARGFTLIELLVVIAIIAILAALIFPALSTARGKANQTKCLQQLAQWATVIGLYAGDHQQKVAWNGVFSASNVTPGPYQSYFTGATMIMNNRWCPSVPYTPQPGVNPPVCYNFVRPVIQGTAASGDYSLTQIPKPASFIVMMDASSQTNKQHIGPSGATVDEAVKTICVNTDKTKIRHFGNVNALFADFHAENVTWANVDKNRTTWFTY